MAERRHRDRHDRVDQLRIEAGVPLSPESVEVRHARLVEMQMESLGTQRRETISTQDYKRNRVPPASMKKIDESRLSNRPGTEEYRSSQEDQGQLSAWNTAHNFLKADGTRGEDLKNLYHGQSHRLRLMQDQLIHPLGGENVQDDSSRRGSMVQGDHPRGTDGRRGADRARGTDHPRGTDSPRGTDRGRGNDRSRGNDRDRRTDHPRETESLRGTDRGRGTNQGGGSDRGRGGDQGRGSDRGRGTDSSLETSRSRGLGRPRGGGRGGRAGGHAGGQNRGSRTERIQTGYPGNSSQDSYFPQDSRGSEIPHTSDKESLTAGHTQSSHPEPSSSENSLNYGATSTQTVPVAAPPAAKRPVPQTWDQRLATPEVFMAALNKGSPTPSAPNHSANQDTLISTSIEIEPTSIHSLAPFSLPADEPTFSYSKDLFGLELGTVTGSSAAKRDDGGKKLQYLETEDSILQSETLSVVYHKLAPIMPDLSQRLKPDSIADLRNVLAQLRRKIDLSSSSAATHGGTEVQDMSAKQPPPSQTNQDLPLDKLEISTSSAASSNASTILNPPEATHSELKGKVREEIVAQQAYFSRSVGQANVHGTPSRKGREDMIIGTHLMPGQGHRQGITRSNSGGLSVDRPTQSHSCVGESIVQSSLAVMTSKFNKLHLGRTVEDKTAKQLATANPFGSTPFLSDSQPPTTLKSSLPGTLTLNENPFSTTEKPSATRHESSWYGSNPNAAPLRTGIKDPNTGFSEPLFGSPFIQHDTPAEGSHLNRTGFFRLENQSYPWMSQHAPAHPLQPVASNTAQGQREQATPGTYGSTSQNLGSVRAGPSSFNSRTFLHPENQPPGPSSQAAPTAQPVLARSTVGQSHLAPVTPSVVTNQPWADDESVFKTTFVPTGPSPFSRTGLLREENQYPGLRKSKK